MVLFDCTLYSIKRRPGIGYTRKKGTVEGRTRDCFRRRDERLDERRRETVAAAAVVVSLSLGAGQIFGSFCPGSAPPFDPGLPFSSLLNGPLPLPPIPVRTPRRDAFLTALRPVAPGSRRADPIPASGDP